MMMGLRGQCVDAVFRAGGLEVIAARERESTRLTQVAVDRVHDLVAAAADGMPSAEGALPEGLFRADWSAFAARFGSSARQRELLSVTRVALLDAREHGFQQAVVGGSFVQGKLHPGDVDIALVSTRAGHELAPATQALHGASDVHMYHAHHVVADRARLDFHAPADYTMLDLLTHDRAAQPYGGVMIPLDTV